MGEFNQASRCATLSYRNTVWKFPFCTGDLKVVTPMCPGKVRATLCMSCNICWNARSSPGCTVQLNTAVTGSLETFFSCVIIHPPLLTYPYNYRRPRDKGMTNFSQLTGRSWITQQLVTCAYVIKLYACMLAWPVVRIVPPGYTIKLPDITNLPSSCRLARLVEQIQRRLSMHRQ